MCLLKSGACLIQVSFNAIAFFRNRMQACLKQVACLIDVVTMTGFTVFGNRKQLVRGSLTVIFAVENAGFLTK